MTDLRAASQPAGYIPTPAIDRIEADIAVLPWLEQLRLMEWLARHIRTRSSAKPAVEYSLAAMANDPDIRRELREIEAEFAAPAGRVGGPVLERIEETVRYCLGL